MSGRNVKDWMFGRTRLAREKGDEPLVARRPGD